MAPIGYRCLLGMGGQAHAWQEAETMTTTLERLCDGIAMAAGRIGEPGFHRALLDAWRDLAEGESGQVMYFDRTELPRYIDVFHTTDDVRELYEGGFGRWCPFYRYWHDEAQPGVRAMAELRRTGVDYGDYFSVFYPKTGMVDEVGVLLPITDDAAIGVFLERSTPFRENEIDTLRITWQPFYELHRAHVRLLAERTMRRHAPEDSTIPVAIFDRHGREVSGNESWRVLVQPHRRWMPAIREALASDARATPLDAGAALIVSELPPRFVLAPGGRLCAILPDTPSVDGSDLGGFLIGRLTPRERDIVRLVLEGHPVAAIAARLQLSENTIKSHRKRLFAKLDITTERELFVMFVEHLTRGAR
jgi:DNA-binding CsgD family transcriptional regulator